MRSSSRPAQTNSIIYLLMCGELTVLFPFLFPSQRASYGTKITRWWCRLTARSRTPGSSTSGPLQSLLCSGSTTQTQYTSTRRLTTRPRLLSACSWALPERTSDTCILFSSFIELPCKTTGDEQNTRHPWWIALTFLPSASPLWCRLKIKISLYNTKS